MTGDDLEWGKGIEARAGTAVGELPLHGRAVAYDLDDLRAQFLGICDDCLKTIDAQPIASALGKDLLKQAHRDGHRLRSRLEEDFSFVVIGDFKRGKSMLINALLGTPVVTTNVTPETITLNEIAYGSQCTVEACLEDGGRVRLVQEELTAERLAQLLEQLPQPLDHLSIKVPVPWLEGLRLVDTPGTGDVLKRFDRQVHDYLVKADMVCVLISPFSPLSETERAFLRSSVIPHEFPKVFFVLNMMDFARTDEEAARLHELVKAKVHELFPNARVFSLSALDEFCCLQSHPRPNPNRAAQLSASFTAFRQSLDESVLARRAAIQLDRTLNQMTAMLQSLESGAQLVGKALHTDQARLKEAIVQCEYDRSQLHVNISAQKQALRVLVEALSAEALQWMDEFISRLHAETIPSLSQFSFEDIQRHSPFFLSDALQRAFDACLNAHEAVIESHLQEMTGHLSGALDRLLEARLGSGECSTAMPVPLSWTGLDTVHCVAGLTGTRSILELVQRLAKNRTGAVLPNPDQQYLERALPQLRQAMTEHGVTTYRNLANALEEAIEAAYKRHIEQAVAAMRQAEAAYGAGEQRVRETHQSLEEALTRIADTRTALESLKGKMGADIR